MKIEKRSLMPDLVSLFTDPTPLPNYLQISEQEFSELSREEQFWILQKLKLKYESLNVLYQAHCGRNASVKGGAPSKWTEEELGFFSDWLDKIKATPRENAKKLSEMAALRILVREMLENPAVEETMRNTGFWVKAGKERRKQIEEMATGIKQALYRQKKKQNATP